MLPWVRYLGPVAAAGAAAWPGCSVKNRILRGLGDFALFTDVLVHGGTSGCFLDNCESSDKFYCDAPAQCGAVCNLIPECQFWTYGVEDGGSKCWLRTSDDAAEVLEGFLYGSRDCHPPLWPECIYADADMGSETEALVSDLTNFANRGGCRSGNCRATDTFTVTNGARGCAGVCQMIDRCTHWSLAGEQCRLFHGLPLKRAAVGVQSGVKDCVPLEVFAEVPVFPPKGSAEAPGNVACWAGGYTFDLCCAESFGNIGNSRCWDGSSFTFEGCCIPPGRREL
mmetsp:Transcript_48544/g.105743  ORF Transcript_48544/g.105743 Transcript_48544/m.105743 type:complete len:282 (+) Transcript_48544:26-871(+)